MRIDIVHQVDEKKDMIKKFKGLINEGTTCYLNSLLQTLFYIRGFRNAVF